MWGRCPAGQRGALSRHRLRCPATLSAVPPPFTGEGDHAKHGGGGVLPEQPRNPHAPPPPFLLLALPAHACDGGPLFERLAAAPTTQPDRRLDVAEIQSTEGGEWQVWLAEGGAARELVRVDYSESGRDVARLVVSSPPALAVTRTSYLYSAPGYVSGSMVIWEGEERFA